MRPLRFIAAFVLAGALLTGAGGATAPVAAAGLTPGDAAFVFRKYRGADEVGDDHSGRGRGRGRGGDFEDRPSGGGGGRNGDNSGSGSGKSGGGKRGGDNGQNSSDSGDRFGK